MVWRQPQNPVDDCYFCLCKIRGYNKLSKSNIVYPNLETALKPVAHCELICNLGLTKENAELLGSRLKEKNLLMTHTSFSWNKNR